VRRRQGRGGRGEPHRGHGSHHSLARGVAERQSVLRRGALRHAVPHPAGQHLQVTTPNPPTLLRFPYSVSCPSSVAFRRDIRRVVQTSRILLTILIYPKKAKDKYFELLHVNLSKKTYRRRNFRSKCQSAHLFLISGN
jgi:hypothetical protein